MDWDTAWREIRAEIAALDRAIARWDARLRRLDAWPRPLARPLRAPCRWALDALRAERAALLLALVMRADAEARGLA